VDAADHRQSDIADRNAPWRSAVERAKVRVTVNDEVGSPPVDRGAEFAIAKHPILGSRFAAQRRSGWGEMGSGDTHVGIDCEKRPLEKTRFSARPQRQPLQSPGVNGVRPLDWPESTSATGRPGDAQPYPAVERYHGRVARQDCDPFPLEHFAKGCSPQGAKIVVAKHGNHRKLARRKQFRRSLRFWQPSVFGQVSGDDKHVRRLVKRHQLRPDVLLTWTPDMKIADCGDPHDACRNRRRS
jgi:hypothetical protein